MKKHEMIKKLVEEDGFRLSLLHDGDKDKISEIRSELLSIKEIFHIKINECKIEKVDKFY